MKEQVDTVIGGHGAHDHEHDEQALYSKVVYGFWVFVLSNWVMFAILFAAYAVLKNHTFGNIDIRNVATLPYVLVQTLVLLAGNFIFGFSLASFYKKSTGATVFWLLVTFLFGLVFLGFDWHIFSYLFSIGSSWHESAFLSSFFLLVGMHGVFILAALIWMLILVIQFCLQGTSWTMRRRMACLGLFWHSLNVLWLLIFILVFLMGAI